MRIAFINPGLVNEREFLREEGIAWKAARAIFNKFSRVKLGGGNEIPPFSLMVLAALTPPEFDVTIVDENVEEIKFDCDFDIVGITLLTFSALHGYEIADKFREKGVKVVLGGIHATVLPEEAAQHADAVVIGEAEGIWSQVLADAKGGMLKKYYRSKAYCNMRGLPIPRRDLLAKKRYLTTNLIQTTRGCPNWCSFCSVHAIAGKAYRRRPIPEVISELETFSNPVAVFVDDNIVGSHSYAKKLFQAMIPLKIKWWGQATLSITEDDELLELAAKSGCKILVIGFESLSKANIKAIGKEKTNKVSNYEEAVKKLHSNGICVQGSFIFGLDNDDINVFRKTVEFIQKNSIDLPSTCLLTPYPGTRLFKKLEAESRLLYKNWHLLNSEKVGKPVFQPKLMAPEELERGFQFVNEQIYSLVATAKRSLAVRKNPIPAMTFCLKRRKEFKKRAIRNNLAKHLDLFKPRGKLRGVN
jgi:radical SAM superfamily enzyme YgiQ (UPF0313 family)